MKKVFVISPFGDPFDWIYQSILAQTFCAPDFKISRADTTLNSRNIMHDIIEHILESDLIIADLTNKNPNVFYELGIAHSFKKKVLQISQNIEDVPFDIRAYRTLLYDLNESKGKRISELIAQYSDPNNLNSILFGNPVTDYVSLSRQPTQQTQLDKPIGDFKEANILVTIALLTTDIESYIEEYKLISSTEPGSPSPDYHGIHSGIIRLKITYAEYVAKAFHTFETLNAILPAIKSSIDNYWHIQTQTNDKNAEFSKLKQRIHILDSKCSDLVLAMSSIAQYSDDEKSPQNVKQAMSILAELRAIAKDIRIFNINV
jgi:hypothetical protein